MSSQISSTKISLGAVGSIAGDINIDTKNLTSYLEMVRLDNRYQFHSW